MSVRVRLKVMLMSLSQNASLTAGRSQSLLREGDRGSEAVLYLLPQARRGRSYLVAEAISN